MLFVVVVVVAVSVVVVAVVRRFVSVGMTVVGAWTLASFLSFLAFVSTEKKNAFVKIVGPYLKSMYPGTPWNTLVHTGLGHTVGLTDLGLKFPGIALPSS